MCNLWAVGLLFLSGSLALATQPPTALVHIGPDDFTTKILGKETVEGHNYLIMQAEARDGQIARDLGYCRIRAWYDLRARVTRKVMLLDYNDMVLTTIRFSGYSLTTGRPSATHMEVTDHSTGETTVFDLKGHNQARNPRTLI